MARKTLVDMLCSISTTHQLDIQGTQYLSVITLKKWILDNYEYDFKTVVVGKGVDKDIMCKLYRDEQGPDARVMLVTGGGRRC